MKKILLITSAALIIVSSSEINAGNFLTSTEHDPVLIGQKSEIGIGKNTDRQLKRQYRVSTDENLNQRINAIGQKLAVHSSRKNLKYTFTVLDAELVNAFAAPGGFIYITTGILKRLQSEDEIAGVLGHEIGHVVHRHSLKAIQRRLVAQIGLQVVAAKFGDSGNLSSALLFKASELSAGLLLLKNSRVNELQADSEGVKIMHAAGYNPHGMIELQEMLLGLSKGKNPPAIISTHPPSRERINEIKKTIAKLK
jgi:predicted Zn-dependent protease